MSSVPLEYCTGCGERIQQSHWVTCPVCGKSLNGNARSFNNPYIAENIDVPEARRDLRWAGNSMVGLAVAGFAGFLINMFRGGWALSVEQSKFGIGAIVFASMVGGGLLGASKQRRTSHQRPSIVNDYAQSGPGNKFDVGINKSAAAKGALLGLAYSLGAIFLVMAIVTLIVVCLVIFLIAACMTNINK